MIQDQIKKDFVNNSRGSIETRRQDMSWIEAKTKTLIEEGIVITPKELYAFCKGKVGDKSLDLII